MTMFIRIASVCDALEMALPRLSRETGDLVRFLLDTIPDESLSLCFVPIRAGCVTELWAHYMYVNDHQDAATLSSSTVYSDCVTAARGPVVFPLGEE